jgi:hypothetical protein
VGFVTAAYLLVAALFAFYALTVAARQRLIADLADAASSDIATRAAGVHDAAPSAPTGR